MSRENVKEIFKMDTKTVLELEGIMLCFDQIRDLLLMLADCALEGTNSIEQYGSGITLIATLSDDNTKKLHMLFDKACAKTKKEV